MLSNFKNFSLVEQLNKGAVSPYSTPADKVFVHNMSFAGAKGYRQAKELVPGKECYGITSAKPSKVPGDFESVALVQHAGKAPERLAVSAPHPEQAEHRARLVVVRALTTQEPLEQAVRSVAVRAEWNDGITPSFQRPR